MKKKLLYALSLAMVVGTSGCDFADFGDTNVDPSVTTQPNTAALLTNSLSGLAGGWVTERRLGYYAQYFTETQYPGVSLYSLPQAGFSGTYSGVLYDLQNIKNLNPSKNMVQVSTIVQQYIFWNLTDRWGDIPYSEALQGQNTPSPKYDTQEDVYKGILKALTDAVAAMDGSAISGDIIYGGSAASWKRFANSLRMIASVQLSKKYPGAADYAATQFKAALADAGGYIATNAQNATLQFNENYANPIWGFYNGRADDGESQTMTNYLKGLNDARLNPFGGNSHTGGTGTSGNGTPYGLSEAAVRAYVNANPDWARILRGDLRTRTSAVPILTASQTALVRAEAVNLGWGTGENMQTVFNSGVTLNHEMWGTTPSAGYFTQPDLTLDAANPASADNIRKIALQRWIASYPDGHQGWNIWRKVGQPVLATAPGATNTTKQIVQRMTYAAAEYTNNAANIAPVADRLKAVTGAGNVNTGATAGDNQDTKVWWARN